METGGPFKNCPPLSSISPYLVLLGARLGAIRAQKYVDRGELVKHASPKVLNINVTYKESNLICSLLYLPNGVHLFDILG